MWERDSERERETVSRRDIIHYQIYTNKIFHLTLSFKEDIEKGRGSEREREREREGGRDIIRYQIYTNKILPLTLSLSFKEEKERDRDRERQRESEEERYNTLWNIYKQNSPSYSPSYSLNFSLSFSFCLSFSSHSNSTLSWFPCFNHLALFVEHISIIHDTITLTRLACRILIGWK